GDPAAVFAKAGLEQALVIGVDSDLLFSVEEQRAVAQALQAGGAATRFAHLQCLEGHASLLIDIERFGREIRSFLDQPESKQVSGAGTGRVNRRERFTPMH